ncbi:hypothetical protein VCHA54P500_110141 [Vibrio chagasii]|nr:hypothetical protein VCHA34P117_110141 [Vibrio chagasii]CAH6895288.1 hypothetical protein VCHA48P439_110013 [Vibrio chagasii]CAH6904932.1 hypothetical protein VCHA40O236_110141 [Vibrio chagasii]CAH6954369.1 hypothetical protein VCHA54P500_110141 [Vibrio chagasii]CAH7144279.1 hypothetical protein VCHA53O462_110141 [Vibrio chagasii]
MPTSSSISDIANDSKGFTSVRPFLYVDFTLEIVYLVVIPDSDAGVQLGILVVVGDSRYLVPRFWNDEVLGTGDQTTMNGK